MEMEQHCVYHEPDEYIHLTDESPYKGRWSGLCGHEMPPGMHTAWAWEVANLAVDKPVCPACERMRKAREANPSFWEQVKALFGG